VLVEIGSYLNIIINEIQFNLIKLDLVNSVDQVLQPNEHSLKIVLVWLNIISV